VWLWPRGRLGGEGKPHAMRRRAWGEKPRFKHSIMTIGFGINDLLAIDFDGGKFLCTISWVHNG
jgi:hypothetical protein